MKLTKNIINEYKGKIILITGGTGSIGLSIIERLLKCKPKAIRILTNDENSIFEAKRILGNNPLFTYIMADIRDENRLKLAIRNTDIIFHAAAMKHVDLCEQNPFDAVKTNVIGTSNVIQAALLEDVSKFILISTDKATNPSSTLGASKLLAERLTINAVAYKGTGKTIFSIIRFGNVIGSRGSVFQIFLEQLQNGSPLTVTDSKMTRFIMSLSEAASMILKVTNIAKDGEVFVLKMPSVKIIDLAKTMIDIFNIKHPYETKSSKIKILKARDGERFHEFLMTKDELPYCEKVGNMFKISKKKNKNNISIKELDSEHAKRISKKELEKIIKELM